MDKVRVALYSRVSTRDKGQENTNQLARLREYCARQHYEIVAEFVDNASGKNGDREAFKSMFAAASRREFDLLLFWSLDRFSREGALATLQALQRLSGCGVAYQSLMEEFLNSAGIFREALISILAVLARQERVRLSERTTAGLERARQQGRIGGRPRVTCTRDKVLALRQAGKSLSSIAAELGVSKTTISRLVNVPA